MERIGNVLSRILVGCLFLIEPTIRIHVDADDVYIIEDRALMSVKNGLTSGEKYLSHWNSNAADHCLWPEIDCDESNFIVGIYITKKGSGLSGRLADLTEGLVNLTRLQYLVITGTKIHGVIPDSLGHLKGLKELDLSSNNLTGSIPDALANLLSLEYLFLLQNNLSGPIPSLLANLMNLTALDLSENTFTGTIPPDLANLTNLLYLDLSQNCLTGIIPSTLGNLEMLIYLSLSNNTLSGEIPMTLTDISSLGYLDLSNNKLEGNIPCNGSFKFVTKRFENNPKLETKCEPTSVLRDLVHSSCDTDPVCASLREYA